MLGCSDDPFAPERPHGQDLVYTPPRDGRVPDAVWPEAARRVNAHAGVVRMRARPIHFQDC